MFGTVIIEKPTPGSILKQAMILPSSGSSVALANIGNSDKDAQLLQQGQASASGDSSINPSASAGSSLTSSVGSSGLTIMTSSGGRSTPKTATTGEVTQKGICLLSTLKGSSQFCDCNHIFLQLSWIANLLACE